MSFSGWDQEPGIVVFNDWPFPAFMEDFAQLNTFQDKMILGDPSRESDQLISSKIWTDFTGGFGTRDIREGSSTGGYEWAEGIDNRRPYQLSLGRRYQFIDEAPTFALGVLGDTMYAASATQLYGWDEANLTFGSPLNAITDSPVQRAEEFGGLLWIPQGDGYQTWDGASMSAQDTTVQAIDFAEWDNRLFAITDNQKLMAWDGASWDERAVLHASVIMRTLDTYMDSSGEDVIAIGTNKGLYMWDDYTGRLVHTRLRYPRHPHNALGMATWRVGEDLFVTAGMSVFRYTGPSVAPNIGLNTDNFTVPAELRGKIVDLMAEHNGLYALVEGVQTTGAPVGSPATKFDPGLKTEGNLTGVPTMAKSMLCEYTGHGWRVAWVSPSETIPYWSALSDADDTYRLWWGTADGLWTQTLPTGILNPEELMLGMEGDFTSTGYIQSGWFDAGMRKFQKLGSHMEVEFKQWPSSSAASMQRAIDYGAFEGMAATFGEGNIIIPLGVETLADGTTFSRGELFDFWNWILQMGTDDPLYSPIVDSVVLKYIRRPLKGAGWVMQIPFDFDDEEWHGISKLELKRRLDSLIDSPGFVRFQHGPDYQRSRRVYVSRLGGLNLTGDDQSGYRDISVTEVRLPGGGFDGS
jgi:hypothetical protein